MHDYGINVDGNGTVVGLWFRPGIIQSDGNDYWPVTLGELRKLVNGASTSPWDQSLGDEYND